MLKEEGILKYVKKIAPKSPEVAPLNNRIGNYVAFNGVDKIFNIENVMKQELIDITDGVKISRPVKVSMGFPTRFSYCNISISHNGVLAICTDYNILFINLLRKQQVEMYVEDYSNITFYDNKI